MLHRLHVMLHLLHVMLHGLRVAVGPRRFRGGKFYDAGCKYTEVVQNIEPFMAERRRFAWPKGFADRTARPRRRGCRLRRPRRC